MKLIETATDTITAILVDKHASLLSTQLHTSYLTRLDYATRARTAYLTARTATLQKRARQCIFEGNILRHVTEICIVYFTLIKNTVSTYEKCFPPSMMSACVVWAKDHLDGFNVALERALSGAERRGKVWQEGLARAREMSKGMDEVGLDFGGMVGRGLD